MGYVNEGQHHAVIVSPLWTSARDCALYVFASQLEKLSRTGKISMREARAQFLIRCGERLKLTYEQHASYELATNRTDWNLHITQLTDQQAKGILWWDDPDQQARKAEQDRADGGNADGSRGPGPGGPANWDPNAPQGGPGGKESVFNRAGFNLQGGNSAGGGTQASSTSITRW